MILELSFQSNGPQNQDPLHLEFKHELMNKAPEPEE